MFRTQRLHGVELKERFKSFSLHTPITDCPLPESVAIPLLQHKGTPAQLMVGIGEGVKRGQILAQAADGVSAAVHSSVSGVVKEIKEIRLYNGFVSQALVIALHSEQNVCFPPSDWEVLSSKEIFQRINFAGIVGLGGATFPTSIKLSGFPAVDTLVVNGAECEPYLSCDQAVLQQETEKVFAGISIVKKLMGARQVWIGIEKENHDSIAKMQEAIDRAQVDFQIKTLSSTYPQGDEKLLIRSCTGILVPADQLPGQQGILVLNVMTLRAIYEAVALNKPLIERILTLSGPGMKNPGNVRVPLGTSMKWVVQQMGGLKEGVTQILAGGPMMGFSLPDLDTPVVKGVSGILAFEDALVPLPEKEQKCIRCSLCIDACPFGIQPQLLYELLRKRKYEKAKIAFLFYCKECGCCDYVCPAKIPLVSYFKEGKRYLSGQKKSGKESQDE